MQHLLKLLHFLEPLQPLQGSLASAVETTTMADAHVDLLGRVVTVEALLGRGDPEDGAGVTTTPAGTPVPGGLPRPLRRRRRGAGCRRRKAEKAAAASRGGSSCK